MATAKKPSGLGRGLGDLLDDNTPEIKAKSGSVQVKKEETGIKITPKGSAEVQAKTLFDTPQHKNRSVKANFKK